METRIHDGIDQSRSIVNRVRELSELRAGVDEALLGRGQIFTISGEPGIGKSRVADEVARYSIANGALALWGRCWEGGGAPAYWPWVQIVRELMDSSDQSSLAKWTDTGAAEIAQIVPELRSLLPGIPELADSSLAQPEQARFRLFDSMVSFLRRSAEAQPLMVVLEDLHAADPTSLLLLAALAKRVRGARLIVIGTYREIEIRQSPDHAALIAEAEREGVALHLRGLGEPEIGEFIERTSGIAASAPLVSLLGSTTGGNPFFLSEILRLMAAEDQLTTGAATVQKRLRIPDGVRESINRRITPLSDETREILATASVIGREFDIILLESISRFPRDSLIDLLDKAMALELVTEVSGTPGCYSFRHALIRETLYEALPTSQRRKLHSIAGDAIRGSFASEIHSAEIAYHYCKAAPMGDAALAVEYSRRAARLSQKQLAYEEASRHLSMALEVLPFVREGNELLRAELLFEFGQAQNRAGDLVEANKTLLQSAEIARHLKQSSLFARAVVEAGRWFSDSGTTDRTLVALLTEASRGLGETDSPVRAQVLARLGIELYWSERPEGGVLPKGVALCERALDMARRLDDPHTSIIALWAHHLSLRNPDCLEQRLADTAEVIRIAEVAGERDFALEARFYRISELLEAGDIAGADVEQAEYLKAEAELRDRFKRGLLLECMRAHLDGRLEEAETLAQQAFVAGQASRRPVAYDSFLIHKGMNLWERGRLREIETQLRTFISQHPLIVFARCGLLLLLLEDGREGDARIEFETLAKDDFAPIPRDWNWIPSMFVLADVSADLRDTNRAATIYRLLTPYASRNAMLGNVYSYGSVNYELGRLAMVTNHFDEAGAHFEAALIANKRIRSAVWVAYTQQEYANLLIRRAREDDTDRAVELFSLAHRTAETLQIVRLQAKLARLARQSTHVLQAFGIRDRQEKPASTSVDFRENSRHTDGKSSLATVLFVDIVESTTRAIELGDRHWRDLLSTFDATVREQFKLHEGTEVDNPGDGFLAVFGRPADAIRAGWSINNSVESLGLKVRVGIHTGEFEWIGKKAVGITVHIGARVAGEAQPGEVMVSGTVRDLLAGSRITFQDRGWRTLKGIADKWRLFNAQKPSD
jgi:eukaryotic-like serine/threonine-protein kinase